MTFARGGIDPYNPPFVVPVQVDPRLNEFIPLFTGYVLQHVEATAAKNQARKMFLELLQQDDRALAQMVQELANLTQFAVDSEDLQPNQVELAIRNLVEVVAKGYLAQAVDTYPQQFGQVLNQQQGQEVGEYINALNNVRQQAQDFYNRTTQNNGWGNAGGGNRAAMSRGGGGGWGRNAQPARQANPNYGQNRPSRWDEPDQGGDGSNYQPATQDKWPGNRMTGGYGNGSDAVFANGGGGATAPRTTTGNSSHSRPAREFAVHRGVRREVAEPVVDPRITVIDGVRFFPARQDQDWPKIINEQRIWDWVLLEDGTQLRPAYQSTWKPSFNPDQPVTPWYDPQEQILFHYKHSDGKVYEHLLKREKTMEYLDHELDPNLRRISKDAAQAREGKAAPAWEMVESLKPNPSSPLATAEPLSEDAEGAQVRVVNPSDFLKTTGLADAVKRASLKLKVEHPGILNQAFELYIERAVLTTVIDPDFDLLYEMANAESFKKLYELMVEVDADPELLNEVDARIVTAIGEALTKHMGLVGWSISNFREDFGDLLAALKEDYGDSVNSHLEENATEIIARALAYYGEKDLAGVRDTVQLDENVVALVWRERSSVTRLPITAEQVLIPVDTGVLVSSTAYPEMYKTLSKIFLRTEDIPHVYHGRYLVTTDGVAYALYNGYLGSDSILVYKTGFDIK